MAAGPSGRALLRYGEPWIPLAAVIERLGGEVRQDGRAFIVDAFQLQVSLRPGQRAAVRNGLEVTLPEAPWMVEGRVYVGGDSLSVLLGGSASFDAAAGRVEIRYEDPARRSRCDPDPVCTSVPARVWGDESDHPDRYGDGLWAVDQPKRLGPVAFGVLDRHSLIEPDGSIGGFSLRAPMPRAPAELPVYRVGSYPESFLDRCRRWLPFPERWECIPSYSLVDYVSVAPWGRKVPVASPGDAERLAAQRLRALVMPDTSPIATALDGGGWKVVFERGIEGYRVGAHRPLLVILNDDGRISRVDGRRCPLLAASPYPLRTPEDAWRQVAAGRWVVLDMHGPVVEGRLDTFVVTHVEIMYHEGQVHRPSEWIQPYYVFFDAAGRSVAVPAVADPWVTWPSENPSRR